MPKDKYSYFTQGTFKPTNPQKFMGRTAKYRSSYELAFFRWADRNPNVLKWGSENVVIPYISKVDNNVHRYFVDNFVMIKEGAVTKKYLIEIKPQKQTVEPVITKRKKTTTILYEQTEWARNTSKWEAAQKWAKIHGMEFIILTEHDLGI